MLCFFWLCRRKCLNFRFFGSGAIQCRNYIRLFNLLYLLCLISIVPRKSKNVVVCEIVITAASRGIRKMSPFVFLMIDGVILLKKMCSMKLMIS